MPRALPAAVAAALITAGAFSQSDMKSQLQRATAPIRHAGVYHVATGTWTSGARLKEVVGPDTIYDNTCTTGGYFAPMVPFERFQHRSRVPTTKADGAPTTASQFYGAPRRDESPGSAASYLVTGFQFAYCSTRSTPFDMRHEFADSYTLCGNADMIPNPGASFDILGLPGGTPTGAQRCWVVDVDLGAGSLAFPLAADGDGVYVGPSDTEQFGWSFETRSAQPMSVKTGPIVAGNYTWTGGPAVGALTPCTGTDGTIWDCPVNLSEPGTGMASEDKFRLSSMYNGPSGYGCYYFGGTLHADFYLKLFAETGGAGTDCDSMTAFCLPGQGLVPACPCGNPPAGGGLGCDNFGMGPADSGTLDSTGTPSLAGDTVILHATGLNATSLAVFWAGTASLHPTGVPHGAGVRCVHSSLKRLYVGNAAAGAISRPAPGDPSVSARSAALGSPIVAGESRYYFDVYRDPAAAGPCGNPSSTINLTNAGALIWGP